MPAMNSPSELRQQRRQGRAMDRRVVALIGVAVILVVAVADWAAGGFTHRLVYGTATLRIDSVPAGARVAVDGMPVGVTPLEAAVLAGTRVLKISHRFHPDYVERVTLQRGATVVRAIDLLPGYGELRVVSNPESATVSVNGQVQPHTTPIVLEQLLAGSYTLEISQRGRTTVTLQRDVLPGQTTEVNVELELAKLGTLSIRSNPAHAAIVLLDQSEAYRPGMELPVGRYRARVAADGYRTAEIDVKIGRGPNLAEVTLQRLTGALQLDLRPRDAVVTIGHHDGDDLRFTAYTPGMRLPTGTVTVRARALGYRSIERRWPLTEAGLTQTIALGRIDAKAKDVISDPLRSGGMAPAVVVIAAGKFRMGVDDGTLSQSPAHTVTVSQPFAIGVNEVTRGEYQAFTAATGRSAAPRRRDETDQHAMAGLDWKSAVAYTTWLSEQTGHRYRLPTEAEWEFAARAGSTTPFTFGSDPTELCRYGNVADATLHKSFPAWNAIDCSDGYVRIAPVGQFLPNAFGLHDVHGNVSEWVADCWHMSYENAPSDGSAWSVSGECIDHVVRGGAWTNDASAVRVTDRRPASTPSEERGFRVVREF
jgi:formylglycine-generating enzyme required for sulfatase activity